jgi:hypothetical protein
MKIAAEEIKKITMLKKTHARGNYAKSTRNRPLKHVIDYLTSKDQ